jgi:hypothetical protein
MTADASWRCGVRRTRMPSAMDVAVCCALLWLASGSSATAQAREDASADEAYLNALQGAWLMSGTLGGKPVRYRAVGERTLRGAWLKLHMVDTGDPPQYQADAWIGYDAKAHDYIVHWLDQFGAAGARVVATGKRDGQTLVVTFPYAEGAFRDTFTRSQSDDSWTLLLESQSPQGQWSTFASYRLVRSAKG